MDDEEDFRIKVRPTPKPKTKDVPWSPKLVERVRNIILTSTDDYVLKDEIAKKLLAPIHDIGHCFSILARERLLEVRPVPTDEIVRVNGVLVHWENGKWIEGRASIDHLFIAKPRRGIRKRYDTRQVTSNQERANKRERAKYLRKNPPVESKWNGLAHFIVRGTKDFIRAAQKAGLPENPVADWACSGCQRIFPYTETYCIKCQKGRFPKEEWAPVVETPKPTCARCGGIVKIRMRHGKKSPDHGLGKCNISMVEKIMAD